MTTIDNIVESARSQKKNILIIGSPRSGTHALGAEISNIARAKNLGEICMVQDKPESWKEIQQLYNTSILTVGQVVQLTPKMFLARDIETIKKHTVIVNIRRLDKVKQFASYVYFRVLDPTGLHGWHNHNVGNTRLTPGSVEATQDQIIQFILEQTVDDYFVPDFNLCYEDMNFTQTKYKKNEFAFPIETMFSNLDYVKSMLGNWKYCQEHFSNEQ